MKQNYLFESERAIYALIEESDRKDYCDIYANNHLMRLTGIQLDQESAKTAFNKTHKASSKQNPNYLLFSIKSKTTQQSLGFMGVADINNQEHSAEIGILLHRYAQGKGFPTESTKATLTFLFRSLELNKINTRFHKNNRPIKRLVQRLGFKPFIFDSIEKQSNADLYYQITNNTLSESL